MASPQKSRILFLRDYLIKYTDEEHMLKREELEQVLAENGFSCARKTFYDDLDAIIKSGVDVMSTREHTGAVRYYVGSRDFQLSEVKLLIDAVGSARFITHKKTEELIKKLESLVSVYQAESLSRQVFVKNRVKSENETIYYAIDTIHTAIGSDLAVTFAYFKWRIDENGTPVREFRHDGKPYTVSPWGVNWNDGGYYMIGYDHNAEAVRHFRIDRMKSVTVTELKRIKNEQFQSFDIESYSSQVFGMYGGEPTYVELCVPNGLTDVFIDKFGSGADIRRRDDEHFIIGADIAVSRQFYAWLLGLSEPVTIISPAWVAEEMQGFK